MTRKTITINDIKISFLDNRTINDITLVFVHGNSSSAEAFKKQLEDELFNDFRLIALDLPGHGFSNSYESYSLDFFAKIVSQFINELNLKNVVLIAHSLGGHIAIQSSIQIKSCKGIVLLGSTLLKDPNSMTEAFLPHPSMALLFKDQLNFEERALLASSLSFGPNIKIIDKHIQQTDSSFRSKLLSSVHPDTFTDEVAIAQSLNVPLALILGSDDKVISLDYLNQLELPTLWRKSIQIVDNAKHYLHMEQAKTSNALILQFVNSLFIRH